ncbi:hypothetical protein [Bacillus sp. JCM 19041]|uniref:hypothetical protein n=1 Tax=Bacillus sp. JCM 19041 TaxID=1460637 RepID=UPI0006D20CA0
MKLVRIWPVFAVLYLLTLGIRVFWDQAFLDAIDNFLLVITFSLATIESYVDHRDKWGKLRFTLLFFITICGCLVLYDGFLILITLF